METGVAEERDESTAADEPAIEFVEEPVAPRHRVRCPLSFAERQHGQYCIEAACALWDDDEEDCLLKLALLAIYCKLVLNE